MKAKLIGTDARPTFSVKVDATNLPTIPMADSSQARVGDLVLAYGQSVRLKQTVTMGIVSAARTHWMGIEEYEGLYPDGCFDQSGNSGGALLNTRGS